MICGRRTTNGPLYSAVDCGNGRVLGSPYGLACGFHPHGLTRTKRVVRLSQHSDRDPAKGESTMPTGRVKWFDNRKGFGFVEQDTGEDVFVHYSTITGEGFRTLNDGELVSFDVVQGPKGLLARKVERLEAVDEGDVAAETS